MTLDEFRALILTVDTTVTRYEGNRAGNYTVWREYRFTGLPADNIKGELVKHIQVDRFTKVENDQIAQALYQTLNNRDDIAFDYIIDYEVDTGYIHHIFDCQVT